MGEGAKVSGWQQRSADVGQASAAHGCLESLSVSLATLYLYLPAYLLSATWKLQITGLGGCQSNSSLGLSSRRKTCRAVQGFKYFTYII